MEIKRRNHLLVVTDNGQETILDARDPAALVAMAAQEEKVARECRERALLYRRAAEIWSQQRVARQVRDRVEARRLQAVGRFDVV